MVKYLVQYIFGSPETINNALRTAAKTGHLDIVKYLVSAGADELDFALQWAIYNNHSDIVKYLKSLQK